MVFISFFSGNSNSNANNNSSSAGSGNSPNSTTTGSSNSNFTQPGLKKLASMLDPSQAGERLKTVKKAQEDYGKAFGSLDMMKAYQVCSKINLISENSHFLSTFTIFV